jgi:hypothetical protein
MIELSIGNKKYLIDHEKSRILPLENTEENPCENMEYVEMIETVKDLIDHIDSLCQEIVFDLGDNRFSNASFKVGLLAAASFEIRNLIHLDGEESND